MENNKKVVIIIRNAYSFDFGGAERFPIFLSKSLSNHNFEPIIVSHNKLLLDFARKSKVSIIEGWWWKFQKWNGWRAIAFPVYIVWQCILFLWYLKLFKKLQPDIVHIQSKDDFIASTYAARLIGARIVWTDHADLKHIWLNLQKNMKNPLGKLIYRASLSADAITVVSCSEKSQIIKHMPKDSSVIHKIHVVYNGCEDVKSRYNNPNNNKTVNFIIANRLVSDKGISEAIEAFSILNSKYKNTHLTIAGDGPERFRFEKQVKELGVPIDFVGHQEDPYKIISQSDILLQPSYHEGFSILLVEASMLERAIIATKVGGNIEIIKNNETGLLVSAKNAVELEKAMEKLYNDRELRKYVAQNARSQYSKKFEFDKIVKQDFIKIYNNKI